MIILLCNACFILRLFLAFHSFRDISDSLLLVLFKVVEFVKIILLKI